MSDVCADLFKATAPFVVYMHCRPDGSPFYIGKGLPRRAFDFAPSRRTQWHKNIVNKHGRENLIIRVIPCNSEFEAFLLEKTHINLARSQGFKLANLTDGGEGTAGRAPSQAQIDGLAKGRMPGKKGKKGLRPELAAWYTSTAGMAHTKRLGQAATNWLHKVREVECKECGCAFQTKSAKAACCSRKCEQRFRRAGKNQP
jgi:hypothetical protein